MSFPNTRAGTMKKKEKGRAARASFHDNMNAIKRQKTKVDMYVRQSGICRENKTEKLSFYKNVFEYVALPDAS